MDRETLKHIFKDNLTFAEGDLQKYSHDTSIFEVVPEVVVFPQRVSELQELVKEVTYARQRGENASITARAAGSDMSGGPLNDSIILDFTKYFNHIIELGSDYAITEPGVFYRDFEKQTLARGLLFPSYPASRELAALGGIVANNSGGEKSLSYGKTERYVRELEVVLSSGDVITVKPLTYEELQAKRQLQTFEGKLYREMFDMIQANTELIQRARPHVTKNSAGYYLWNVWDGKTFDLTKLFVGSQGTLGLITKIKLGLVKPKPCSELLVMFLKDDDMHRLGDIVNTVMGYKPESFESFDDHTFKLALKFFPAMLHRMKGSVFKLMWQFLPELHMVISGGLPKFILLAEFTGEDEAHVQAAMAACQAAVKAQYGLRTHITKSPEETQKYWIMRRESFNLLRQRVKNLHTAPFIDDITVPVETLPEFLPRLNELFAKYPHLVYTVAGHAGDANFHIIPLMDLANEDDRKIIHDLSEEVYELVLAYKGSIDAEHNDGLIRTPYLEQMYGKDVYALFKKTKELFDPLNIFNPRKKVGGTKEYATEHIKRS